MVGLVVVENISPFSCGELKKILVTDAYPLVTLLSEVNHRYHHARNTMPAPPSNATETEWGGFAPKGVRLWWSMMVGYITIN